MVPFSGPPIHEQAATAVDTGTTDPGLLGKGATGASWQTIIAPKRFNPATPRETSAGFRPKSRDSQGR